MRWIVLGTALTVAAVAMACGSGAALGAPPVNEGTPAAAPSPEAARAAAEAEQKPVTLWTLIVAGDWMMYPLALLSVITVAIIAERLVRLRRASVMPRTLLQSLADVVKGPLLDRQRGLDVCRGHPSTAGRIFEHAFRKAGRPHGEVQKAIEDAGAREVGRLKSNVRMLSMIGVVAPLMGLLGTVSGIIRAFIKITQAGLGNAQMIAGGMYEALVCTAAGLLIAIPAVAFYYYLAHRVDTAVREIDTVAADLVEAVGVPEH